jgi:hypothetical protein
VSDISYTTTADLDDLPPGSPSDVDDLLARPAPASAASTPPAPSRSILWRTLGTVRWSLGTAFDYLSLVTILAVMTALPVIQLIAFGYLLDVAGRLTAGAKFRDTLDWLRPAGRLGSAIVAILIVGLPIHLLTHWGRAADLVSPGTPQADAIRTLSVVLVFLAVPYLGWAWVRGGRVRDYLWPQPIQFLKRGWRPTTWLYAADRLWDFIASWRLAKRFWLGLRGAVATLIWLLPATVIIAANRQGETGLAGLVGALALIAMGFSLMYLPMLQANFAAENRFKAMFQWRRIRSDFRRAPWAWLLAMVLSLVILPIPLYLLKIEPPPPELVWLPTWFFIFLMLPARIACGLALRRARSKPEPSGKWAFISRWTVRLLMPPVVGTYLLFVYLSQYVTWDGLQTWVQQHAVLVPIPFVGI